MKMEVVLSIKSQPGTEASAERVYLNGSFPCTASCPGDLYHHIDKVTLKPWLKAISSLDSFVKSVVHSSSPPTSPLLVFPAGCLIEQTAGPIGDSVQETYKGMHCEACWQSSGSAQVLLSLLSSE